MKNEHDFPKEAGFSGSHHMSKDHHPTIPGFKRGGHLKKMPMVHPLAADTGSNDDEMSVPSQAPEPAMPQPPAMMKKGGRVGGHGHHDTHEKHDQVKYDAHGFQHHKNHK